MQVIGFGYKKRVEGPALKCAYSFARLHFPSIKVGTISFGDQLKYIAEKMYSSGGLKDSVYYDNHPEEIEIILPRIGKSPRQIWDAIGLMGRTIDPNTWVNMAAVNCPEEADVLFSKDIRFPTEIGFIEMFKGYSIKIDRPKAPKGGLVDEALDHYNGWHAVIQNTGSLKEFHAAVKNTTCKILNKIVTLDKVVCESCYATKTVAFVGDNCFKCKNCHHEFCI